MGSRPGVCGHSRQASGISCLTPVMMAVKQRVGFPRKKPSEKADPEAEEEAHLLSSVQA